MSDPSLHENVPSPTPAGSSEARTARAPKVRIQPHMAHVPGPDGQRREIELVPDGAPAMDAEKRQLSELVTANEPWMRALATRRIPPRLQARFDGADVVQAAFLALCERAESGAPAVEGNVKGYLVRAVRNGVHDHVRRHTRERRSARAERAVTEKTLDLHVCPREQPLEAAEKEELRRTLLDALACLDEIDRKLVHLKHVEQLSWPEIGRRLGLPESTARRKGLEAFGRLMRLVE